MIDSPPLYEEFSGTRNRTRRSLADGRTTLGLFLLSGSSMVAELFTTFPIDWLVVDMEASPVSKREVMQIFQALHGTSVTPMVRVPWQAHHVIEQALDLGAHGVLVPKVDTAEAARQVAAACRYPPVGRRGINPVRASGYFADIPGYLKHANERTLCMIQIESREAVENAPAIAAVEGIDVVFIGAGDLACSLGQPGDVTGDAMDRACRRVLDATRAAGKVAGIFAYDIELARRYAREGFTFIALGNDFKLLREALTMNLSRFHAE